MGNPDRADSWFIMTNLPGEILPLPRLYALRTWIEYGFKQVKNELGWADFRLTNYSSSQRWWEVVFSAYLLLSLHANQFKADATHRLSPACYCLRLPSPLAGWNYLEECVEQLASFVATLPLLGSISILVQVFAAPGLKRGLFKLMDFMDQFRILPRLQMEAA